MITMSLLALADTPTVQFSDDFSTDTTGNYATSGSGSLSYDGAKERACVSTNGAVDLKFTRGLSPASDTGSFTIDVATQRRTGSEGEIEVRLYESADTYYKIINRTGGSRTGGITKYVAGVRVDKAWFTHKYVQSRNYQIKVSYSPSSTTVEAFGETLTIHSDHSAIDVSEFSVRTKYQNACYDNIIATIPANGGNTPPVAEAGSDQYVSPGSMVTLDGSASMDPDGDTFTYQWSFTSKPTGSTATLNTANPEYPTFTADKEGNYIVKLVVNDGTVDSIPDTVKVSTTGGNVSFSDDFSSNTVGDYDTSGAGSFVYDATNERACVNTSGDTELRFAHALAPTSDTGTFTLQRTGSEGEIEVRLYESADTYYKIINRTGGSRTGGITKYVAGIRVASAWFNQQYEQGKNYRIKITYSPDSATVEAFGKTLKINSNHSAINVSDFSVRTKYQNACYDNIVSTTAAIGGNTPPVANAGNDKTVTKGTTVTLDGSKSKDADGDSMSYQWSFTSKPTGSTATLNSANPEYPTFTADKEGNYIVKLVVNDGTVDSIPDTVKVTATSGGIGFSDDFSSNTTGNYDTDGSGTFTYDGTNERACSTNSGNSYLVFTHALSPVSDTGTFIIDVNTLQRTGSEGEIDLRLYDNAGNYYKIVNREGGGRTGGLTKYVNGVRVEAVWFKHQYIQNRNYQIKVTYSPNSTTVEAFGETLTIGSNSAPIAVSEFRMKTKAQNACYDNIVYSIINRECPEKAWEKTVKSLGTENDWFNKVTRDSSGNLYAVGFYSGYSSLWVKFDQNGNKIWQKDYAITCYSHFELTSITTDNAGNLYGAGYATDDCDPTDNVILMKFNGSDGTPVWGDAPRLSMNYDRFNDIATDANGNIYAVGYTKDSSGISKARLVKYNSNGIQQCENTIGGSNDDSYNAVAVGSDGYIYAAGSIEDIEYLGGVGTLISRYKSDCTSEAVMDSLYDGSIWNTFNSIKFDNNGYLYAAGNYADNTGVMGALLVKFSVNANGFDELWHTKFSSSSVDIFNDIATDNNGNIYAAGMTQINAASKRADALLVKYDSDGKILCDKSIGGSETDGFNGITADDNGNLFTVGWSMPENSPGSGENTDAWLVKFKGENLP